MFDDFVLSTIVHVKLGEIAFGTSAGHSEIRATLRSYQNDDLNKMKSKAVEIAGKYADEHNLRLETNFVEYFPALENDPDMLEIVKEAAGSNNFQMIELERPFRWSEDFAQFTSKFQGAMFGLGAGENTPKLHNPDYDFPDEILENGIRMFKTIIKKLLH